MPFFVGMNESQKNCSYFFSSFFFAEQTFVESLYKKLGMPLGYQNHKLQFSKC